MALGKNSAEKVRALFFGKHGCDFSKRAYEFLVHLKFEVSSVLSRSRREPLPEDIRSWQGDYIFCFRSYFVLPKSLIDRAKIAALNFHPAPPEYPGSGCLNWALYDNAKQYGVTAHIMNEKVDNGRIVECRRFPILPQDTVTTLLERAHLKTYDLLIDTAIGLAMQGKQFLDRKLDDSKHETWRGEPRRIREIDKLKVINPTCSKEELERIIRATYTPLFPPIINLHGYKFVLNVDSLDESETHLVRGDIEGGFLGP
jgi:methionyl-tRNA formyltransferase